MKIHGRQTYLVHEPLSLSKFIKAVGMLGQFGQLYGKNNAIYSCTYTTTSEFRHDYCWNLELQTLHSCLCSGVTHFERRERLIMSSSIAGFGECTSS